MKKFLNAFSVFALFLLNGCSSPGSENKKEVDKVHETQLAQKLAHTLQQQGLRVPDIEVLTTLYGTTGGLSCIAVGNYQQVAGQNLFGSPNIGRHVIIDPKVIDYDRAVISVYCPEKLEPFNEATKNLKTSETIVPHKTPSTH